MFRRKTRGASPSYDGRRVARGRRAGAAGGRAALAPAPTGESSDAGPRRDWPVYTLAEVALHDRGRRGIVVNDAVYDMTAHVRRRKHCARAAPPRADDESKPMAIYG